MKPYTPDETALHKLAAEIEATPPRPHHAALLHAANAIHSGCTFRYALSRGGWYRPGSVLAANGVCIAESVQAWAASGLRRCGGDFNELIDQLADAGLRVTRHSGRTHYFVAPCGQAPADFLQLEVEELQEVLDRQLIDPLDPPHDLQELAEPVAPLELDAQPVGAPRYRFRRLIDVREVAARANVVRDAGLERFFKEWMRSRAAQGGHFSDHWIVALREHLDRYRNSITSLSLVSRHARELKPFPWSGALSGVEMSSQLQVFDRAAGYPGAWYFHLVAGVFTPPKVAYAVARDLDAGFSYLPDAEAGLLRRWVAAPYSV
jgi:hypothetical protein